MTTTTTTTGDTPGPQQCAPFASWPSVFTSHARFVLVRLAGGRYLVDFGTLYLAGNGRNISPKAH
jgi:hypothetical protein